jgi:hypothetical protein
MRIFGVAAMIAVAACDTGRPAAPAPAERAATIATVQIDPAQTVAVVPGSFLGFGLEPGELATFTGTPATGPNAAFTALLARLAASSGPPVLRVGGNAQDDACFQPGKCLPQTPLAITADDVTMLDRATAPAGVKILFGLNLKSGDADVAVDEAEGVLGAMPLERLAGLEIGNEPDMYAPVFHARPASYSITDYSAEYARFANALRDRVKPTPPLAGASFLGPFQPQLDAFLDADAPLLSLVTVHQYPMVNCGGATGEQVPSIPNLLSTRAARAHADQIAPAVASAHARGVGVRVDELQSVLCHGKQGVSDTFASALWILNALFHYARVGVDGVNVHAHPEGQDFYRPFGFTYDAGAKRHRANVYPIFYGIALFAEAAPSSAAIVQTSATPDGLSVWVTRDRQNVARALVVNATHTAGDVVLRGLAPSATARVVRLTAPAIDATSGVSISGETFDDRGEPQGGRRPEVATPTGDAYRLSVAASSALLATFE